MPTIPLKIVLVCVQQDAPHRQHHRAVWLCRARADSSATFFALQHEKDLAAAAEAAEAAAAKLAEQEAAVAETAKVADAAEHARTAAIEALQSEHKAALEVVKVQHKLL